MESNLENKALCHTLSKAFEVPKATAKVSPEQSGEDDQEPVMDTRRLLVKRSLQSPNWQSERKLKVDRCLRTFPLRTVSKALERLSFREQTLPRHRFYKLFRRTSSKLQKG